jgi:hypothetical protein
MTGILLTLGSVGVVCAAGVGVSAALQWFHTFEPDFSKKSKPRVSTALEGGAQSDRINHLSQRAKPRK